LHGVPHCERPQLAALDRRRDTEAEIAAAVPALAAVPVQKLPARPDSHLTPATKV
jgi:hypothetical protein